MPRKALVTTNPLYWMPLNVQEVLAKIAGALTTEQFGAAMLLILTSWEQQPPCTLPSDPVLLAKVSGLGPKWGRSGPAVLAATQFYEGQNGRLRARWLSDIYKEQHDRYTARSEAGKANRAKREQGDLGLVTTPAPRRRRGTNGSTNGGTRQGTIATSNGDQNEKGEGVVPTGLTPDPLQNKTPSALAPEGARVGSIEEAGISNVRNPLPGNRPVGVGNAIREAMDALWESMSPVERGRARQLAEAAKT